MKKGMLFDLSHTDEYLKRGIILLHFSVSTLKNFLIFELPEPFTDSKSKHPRLVTNIEKGYFFRKKVRLS